MSDEYEIQLSGPFDVTDSSGRICKIESIRIFDEGYGIIDVYVAVASADDDERLHEDTAVVRQILSRLRSLGYDGPDFGPGAEGLQDRCLIVLEAPEEFNAFAAAKGWKNLTDDYLDDEVRETVAMNNDSEAQAQAQAIYAALMRKIRSG